MSQTLLTFLTADIFVVYKVLKRAEDKFAIVGFNFQYNRVIFTVQKLKQQQMFFKSTALLVGK